MPVVARPPRRPEGPSGLERVLRGVGQLANIGTGIANIVTLPRRLDLIEQQIQATEELARQRELDRTSELAANTIQQAVEAAQAARGQLFLGAFQDPAAMADPDTIQKILAAPRLGDAAISPSLKEATREAISTVTGIPTEDISDDFLLSSSNLPGVIDEMRAVRSLMVNLDPSQQAALREAAEIGEVAGLSGREETPERILLESALSAQTNELIQFDPTTQKVTGIAFNKPSEATDWALRALELEPLPREVDTGAIGLPGPDKRVIAGPVWDQVYQRMVESQLRREEDANESINNGAELLSEEFNIPFAVAHSMIMGREVPEQYRGLSEMVQRQGVAAAYTLGAISPTYNLVFQLGTMLAKDLEAEGMKDVMESLSHILDVVAEQEGFSDLPVLDAKTGLEAVIGWIQGSPPFEFRNRLPPQLQPGGPALPGMAPGPGNPVTGLPSDTGRQFNPTPDQLIQAYSPEQVESAFRTVIENGARALRGLSDEAINREIELFLSETVTIQDPATGEVVEVTPPPEVGDLIRERIQELKRP